MPIQARATPTAVTAPSRGWLRREAGFGYQGAKPQPWSPQAVRAGRRLNPVSLTQRRTTLRQLKGFVVAGTVAGLLALGGGVAVAHTERFESNVNIRYNAAKDRFQGHVRSEKPQCERRRNVVVYKKTPGAANPEVGSDRTNENGYWRVPVSSANGEYYARVLRRVRATGSHKHVCLGDRSRAIEVEPGPS